MATEHASAAPTVRAALHTALERLIAAADEGRPLDAFLSAAVATQLVADRLQGVGGELHRIQRLLLRATGGQAPPARPLARAGVAPPSSAVGAARSAALRVLDTAQATAAATRGRLGLAEYHVLLRDLANVLAEAVLCETVPDAEGPDAKGILLSVAVTVDGLRSGIPPQAARLLAGAALPAPLDPDPDALELHPAHVMALAERFARLHPDRERPLLVLGLRPFGAYLAPLAAAALGHLDYRHVVARTTRAGGPLLPEEPRLPESVRRVGGVVLLLGPPPATGASYAAVASRLVAAGFAPTRVVPVYASREDDALPPALLRLHPCVVLPASGWRRAAVSAVEGSSAGEV